MSDDRERRSHFERLYTLEGPADAEAFYADWAATYDADMLERHGYRGPALLADLVAERVPDRRAWILDIGCGTGLVGVELAARGFVHVDGLDLVQAMLDRASRTGVYHRLLKGNLLQRPAVNADRYDHAVSAGTFTHAHVGPDGLDEVVRLVRADSSCLSSPK